MTNDEIRLELFAAKCAELSIKLKNLQEDYKKAGETWEHLCKEKDEEISILQGKIDAFQMSENEANEIIVELKTENAELKEQIKYDSQYNDLQAEIDYGEKLITKYKTCLQEIKKICKMDCGECQYNQDCDCNFEECAEAKIDDILDLITKAEVGNE